MEVRERRARPGAWWSLSACAACAHRYFTDLFDYFPLTAVVENAVSARTAAFVSSNACAG